ncbi:MAG TPA: SDR family NAD(P)-dependent oxidoreductase [Candidatus Acidoferrales bacterium]|nr:SDR family NAD(P)-dependent oxidoreductase [Candidatus Acidoferrales bacterium]
MERVEGLTAFITGGARGIGLGIGRAFARAGMKLAIADIDPDSLAAAKSELAKLTAVETFNLDVRDREAYARVADEAEARLGPVSILCNNAGVAAPIRPTYEFWDWMLGINLYGVINGIQTFVPRMLERGRGGHIVNTASGAGLVAEGSGVMYNTSKFAVVGLSESLRRELEPRGIGVSVLCPGPVATNIVSNSRITQPPPGSVEEGKSWEAITERITGYLATGVAPDRVGEMVLAGVKANRLYIITDRIIEKFVEARMKAILDALPPAE